MTHSKITNYFIPEQGFLLLWDQHPQQVSCSMVHCNTIISPLLTLKMLLVISKRVTNSNWLLSLWFGQHSPFADLAAFSELLPHMNTIARNDTGLTFTNHTTHSKRQHFASSSKSEQVTRFTFIGANTCTCPSLRQSLWLGEWTVLIG